MGGFGSGRTYFNARPVVENFRLLSSDAFTPLIRRAFTKPRVKGRQMWRDGNRIGFEIVASQTTDLAELVLHWRVLTRDPDDEHAWRG